MELARLGRTGLQVSRLGLGTMNFGMEVPEVESHRILDAALEQGINFVDTADVYGLPQSPDMAMGNGLAETIIGNWLARTGRRDEIVLATKVYQPMGLGPNDRGLSAYHIRRACEASLRRLQTDHIPLSDAPRGPGHAVGGDLAGDGATGARRQDQLRGDQQLRGVANRGGTGDGRAAPPPRTGHRTKPVQPHRPHRGTGGRTGLAAPRHRTHPVEPAGAWSARRCAGEGDQRAARGSPLDERKSNACERAWRPTSSCATTSVTSPPRWPSRGCCTSPWSPR